MNYYLAKISCEQTRLSAAAFVPEKTACKLDACDANVAHGHL